MEGRLLKVEEAGKILGFGRARMYALVNEGILPSVRIGRNVRISETELDRWIREQSTPANHQSPR